MLKRLGTYVDVLNYLLFILLSVQSISRNTSQGLKFNQEFSNNSAFCIKNLQDEILERFTLNE